MDTFFIRGFVNSPRKHSDNKSLCILFPCQPSAKIDQKEGRNNKPFSLIPHFVLT